MFTNISSEEHEPLMLVELAKNANWVAESSLYLLSIFLAPSQI